MCFICAQRTPEDLLARLDQHPARGGITPSAANPGDSFWQGFGAGVEGADAAESTGTTYSMIVGQSFYGNLSTGADEDWVAITLTAGQTYDFRLLGVGADLMGDPLLRLRNAAGTTVLAENDDNSVGGTPLGAGNHNRDSSFTYTATTTGTYYLEVDGFVGEGLDFGDYLLSATVDVPEGQIFTVDEIAWQLINSGNAFFDPQSEGAAFVVGADNVLTVNITGLTAEGQYLAQQALLSWTLVTGINFQYTGGVAEITFDDNQPSAFAQPLYSGSTITSSTVNIGTDWLAQFGTSLQSYSFETYIHEIGHALGLAHAGNYNGSASYGTDNYYLNDSLAWTIMSYMNAYNDEFDQGNPGDVNTYVAGSFRYIYTPQIADIIAIQYLYGDNSVAFTGNTTYGVNGNTGITAIDNAVNSGALMAMTVHDDGGTDTLNFSTYGGYQLITLFAESLSSVLGGTHNLGISRGTVVENAVGGSGVDEIYGNNIANALYGGLGADYLYGGNAGDNLWGGAGADQHYGGTDAGVDYARYDDANHGNLMIRLDGQANTGAAAVGDTYSGIEGLVGGAGNDTVVGSTSNNFLFGSAGVDQVYGGVGNDYLDGGLGGDNLWGGTGIDQHIGGNDAGVDYARYDDANHGNLTIRLDGGANAGAAAVGDTYTGIEGLVGGAGNDVVVGNGSNNFLFGSAGADFVYGGVGNDYLSGDAGGDNLWGGTGADAHYGGTDAGVDYARYDDANYGNLTIRLDAPSFNAGAAAVGDTYTGIEGLVGGAGNDVVIGNGLANFLFGSGGSDYIDGQGGNDYLAGGAGADRFRFSAALGGTNIDTIADFQVGVDDILLAQAIFAAIGPTLTADEFRIGMAVDGNDFLLYNPGTGRLFYDNNASAAGGMTHFATVTANTALTVTDFVMV